MKSKSYPIIAMVVCSILFLFGAGCRPAHTNIDKQSENMIEIAPTGDAELDSLLFVAAHAPADTNLIMLYNDIAQIYESQDFEKAKEYYLKVRNLSEQLNWHRGYNWYAIGFSMLLGREGLSDSAIVILKRAHELATEEKNERAMAVLTINIATIYKGKIWHETALEHYMQALSYFEPLNDTRMLIHIYYMLCDLYSSMNMVDKAIEYGEKAYALSPENPSVIGVLAGAYSNDYQYDKANSYLEKALQICELQHNTFVRGLVYGQLGRNALYAFELKKAENYAQLAMENAQKSGTNFCYELLLLSKIEQLKGNYTQSEAYIKKTLQMAEESDFQDAKKFCYLVLSELAVAQGKYRESIQCWKELDIIDQAIAQEATLRAAEEMAVKYETAKKQHEIEKQQVIIAKQKMQRNLLVGSIIGCVIFLALLWYMLHLRTRHNRTLAEMNATKDKFFSIISHDLKNPAVAQRDAIQLLLDNFPDMDAEIAQYLQEIATSAKGQVDLIYNLLGWAQVQTGRMAYQPATINLTSTLRPELAVIQEMAKNKGILFSSTMPENVMVTADKNMMDTIVRNLLTNAVKFTPKGGTVTLDIAARRGVARNAPTTYRNAPTETYIVSISDTGVGIPAEQIENLLRLDRKRGRGVARNAPTRGTANESGTGLGLIICKELLEKHGTTLHIESEAGKGSRFWFELMGV